jgi:hypothetical protein
MTDKETYEIRFMELDDERNLAIPHRHIVTCDYLPRQEQAKAKGLIPFPRHKITAYTFRIYTEEEARKEAEEEARSQIPMSSSDRLIQMVNRARANLKKEKEAKDGGIQRVE